MKKIITENYKNDPYMMKTVKVDYGNGDVEIIQRSGGMVTANGKEDPYAGKDYVDNLINDLNEEGRPYELYYTNYWTREQTPIV